MKNKKIGIIIVIVVVMFVALIIKGLIFLREARLKEIDAYIKDKFTQINIEAQVYLEKEGNNTGYLGLCEQDKNIIVIMTNLAKVAQGESKEPKYICYDNVGSWAVAVVRDGGNSLCMDSSGFLDKVSELPKQKTSCKNR